MPGYHMNRVTEDLRREVADIIRNMKDPRLPGIISVVHAEVSSDLSVAKVHVSCIGGDNAATAKTLNTAAGFIRHELSARMQIRKTPELKFVPDSSIEQSVRIAKILNDIDKDRRDE